MKLEEEIKQKKFKTEYEKLLVNISFTNSYISGQFADLLKPYGISRQQYNILRILRGQHPKPASVNLLINRMVDKMSNASRLVEKLKQKGLVERQECDHDRRQVDVCISEGGLKLLKEIDTQFPEYESGMRKVLTEDEAKQLNNLLDRLRD